MFAGKKSTSGQLGFVGIHTHSVSDSVGLMPAAFPLIRALPKITRRENEVMGRGAGVERGACDYLLNHSSLPRKPILSSFYGWRNFGSDQANNSPRPHRD